MKRLICILSAACLCISLCSCGESAQSSGAVLRTTSEQQQNANSEDTKIDIDITEAGYVTFINDIYTNYEKYLGKTIRIQGMYKAEQYEFEGTQKIVNYVYRVGPGCCGNDGSMCGFEFTYDGAAPANSDWVEVIGTLSNYEENNKNYLTLAASSVKIKQERGKENVKV